MDLRFANFITGNWIEDAFVEDLQAKESDGKKYIPRILDLVRVFCNEYKNVINIILLFYIKDRRLNAKVFIGELYKLLL